MLCSCFGWQKGTSQDEASSSSEKTKPVALCIAELCLAEGINYSQLVSIKFKYKFLRIS